MKKKILKTLSLALCLVFCLQVFFAAGLFPMQVTAANMSLPSKPSGSKINRELAFPHGNYVTCYTPTYGTTLSSISSSAASSYASSMTSLGYTQTKTGKVNNVTYWHFTHSSGGAAYVVHDGKTMYVTTDDRSVTSAFTPRTNYTKITEATLGIQSLDYSHGELGDGNGLCNIWTLEDGSYLILDGGYTYDADRLYNYLYDNNLRPDGKILIHAWYFTHGDGDHYGAFQQFTTKYAKMVTLEQIIANASWSSDPLNSDLLKRMKSYPGVKLVRPHTGETYQFPGLKMDILYTSEDLYMYDGTNGSANDASTVSRVTVGGQTILYTGDASNKACERMISMYGNGLKSDFLQINHHGYSGGTEAFYKKVQPSYILWTSSQYGTEKRTSDTLYQWIGNDTIRKANVVVFGYVGNDYNKVFAADGPVEQMTFPYDGNRDALPTYRAHDDVTLRDVDYVYSEDFNVYNEGSYTANDMLAMLGWTASTNPGGTVYEITEDGKLRVFVPFQNPSYEFDVTTGVGTPKMNAEFVFGWGNLPHFRDGRTVIEYEMTYNESIIPDVFGAAPQIRNESANGAYWLEPTLCARGTYELRFRYNTSWQYLTPGVSSTAIPFNSFTTDYITNPNFKYNGYLITDQYKNFTDSNGDGVYESTMTKNDNTVFGSTDKYKVVIDPSNGVDIYVNGVLIASTDIDDAWRDDIFESIINTRIGFRMMPGMDVTLDDIKIYREDNIPEVIITEIAPGGAMGNALNEYIEVMNNSNGAINIYDYCIVKDKQIGASGNLSYHTTTAEEVALIKPGATTWVPVKNANNAVTHVNPPYEQGVLQPGEVAVLWIPTNTAYNSTSVNKVNTIDMFREALGLGADVKVFSCYNNYNFSLNNSGSLRYGVGYANVDYTTGAASSERNLGRLISYVEHISTTGYTYTASGTEAFKQEYPKTNWTSASGVQGSINYYYPSNNYARHGKLLSSEAGVISPGVVSPEQVRVPEVTFSVNGREITMVANTVNLLDFVQNKNATVTAVLTDTRGVSTRTTETTVAVYDGLSIEIFEGAEQGSSILYSQNFDSIAAFSHTFTDSSASSYYNYTFDYEDLFGWDQMTPTDGSEVEVTSDGKLRIYNPYYMQYKIDSFKTVNYDFQIEIGDFSEMIGSRVVLEYDFKYNDRGTEATSAAVFSFGRHVDPDSYCFAPAMTVQGFYQPRFGTAFGGTMLHSQIRPEWIPYSAKTTGYDYPYGGVTNHYNIYGGTNHVKIEVDPYNGITTYVNGVAISMVQNTENWQAMYKKYMGEILGLSVAPGVEVVLDNIVLYTEDAKPELVITEVGSAMGAYEYIEVYNNSNRDLDIYNYTLMRNTNLASGGDSGEYLGVGSKNGAVLKWTNANIATIKRGTHTYTAQASGQSVTLTNPESGIIKPGEVAILWIPSNTTYDDTSHESGDVETREMFMESYGLTDASKIYAAYNNNNISLWDGSDIAYGLGYAGVDYTTHNVYAMNELESYVYVNTTATTVYGQTEAVAKPYASYASIEYTYAENNSAKRGTFFRSIDKTNTVGQALAEQERTYTITLGEQTYNVPLRVQPGDIMERLNVSTLYGGSIRTSVPTGMRWITSVDAKAYDDLKDWMQYGVITDVEIGTILIRTEDLGDKALTLELVDGVKCHAVAASDANWFEATPTVEAGYSASLVGTHLFAGSVASIKKENYNVKYSAVGYLTVTLADGTVETVYGGYSAEAHSRTVAEVAYKALTDANNGLSAQELEVIASFAAYYEG